MKYLKKEKMPPLCFNNGLELHESLSELKSQGVWLTELEASMIAKRIIFMKIFLLPTSRWTAMKDKAVNVPIPESALLNTIQLQGVRSKSGNLLTPFTKVRRLPDSLQTPFNEQPPC